MYLQTDMDDKDTNEVLVNLHVHNSGHGGLRHGLEGINHSDQMSNASFVLSSSTAVSPYHYDQISQRSQCFTLRVSSEWASLVECKVIDLIGSETIWSSHRRL